jgi:RNase P subunit RPR2
MKWPEQFRTLLSSTAQTQFCTDCSDMLFSGDNADVCSLRIAVDSRQLCDESGIFRLCSGLGSELRSINIS